MPRIDAPGTIFHGAERRDVILIVLGGAVMLASLMVPFGLAGGTDLVLYVAGIISLLYWVAIVSHHISELWQVRQLSKEINEFGRQEANKSKRKDQG